MLSVELEYCFLPFMMGSAHLVHLCTYCFKEKKRISCAFCSIGGTVFTICAGKYLSCSHVHAFFFQFRMTV